MSALARRTARLGVCHLVLPPLALALAALTGRPAVSAEAEPPPPQVEFLSPERNADTAGPASVDRERGNPLWAVPLESLSATRDRPLFTPSRRPSEPAVTPAPAPPPSVPPATPPPRPSLVLMGTVVSTAGSLGIFTDPASGQVLRLKVGEAHAGWTLRSVGARDVVMQAAAANVTLALPAPVKGSPEPPRGAEGPYAAAQVGSGKPIARQVIVPRRTRPSPADLDSSH